MCIRDRRKAECLGGHPGSGRKSWIMGLLDKGEDSRAFSSGVHMSKGREVIYCAVYLVDHRCLMLADRQLIGAVMVTREGGTPGVSSRMMDNEHRVCVPLQPLLSPVQTTLREHDTFSLSCS